MPKNWEISIVKIEFRIKCYSPQLAKASFLPKTAARPCTTIGVLRNKIRQSRSLEFQSQIISRAEGNRLSHRAQASLAFDFDPRTVKVAFPLIYLFIFLLFFFFFISCPSRSKDGEKHNNRPHEDAVCISRNLMIWPS
ncbi:hypothetical protein CLIB1423_06S03114 [[Candida] railenensis]|uniref:Transmembrane protein n=1 Tax=[Candida] railenensis TaxID=45579 RepID=A0A9P0QPV0_9ASCO|nr:hypothetical protein CLIB1423_06S03114 [[Candida] railenensis]